MLVVFFLRGKKNCEAGLDYNARNIHIKPHFTGSSEGNFWYIRHVRACFCLCFSVAAFPLPSHDPMLENGECGWRVPMLRDSASQESRFCSETRSLCFLTWPIMSEQLTQDLGGKGIQEQLGFSKCHFFFTHQAPFEKGRSSSGLEEAPPSTSAGERCSAKEGMAHYLLKK